MPATPPPPEPPSPARFEEDEEGPEPEELESIEMLGAPEEAEAEEEAEVEEAEMEAAPRPLPPRPPKSPDMRPVYAGFLLVGAGLAQFVYGIWAMLQSPHAATGTWSPLIKWGAFAMGFSAAFLGLLAVRGGLWSFRKERFDVVKVVGAAACLGGLAAGEEGLFRPPDPLQDKKLKGGFQAGTGSRAVQGLQGRYYAG